MTLVNSSAPVPPAALASRRSFDQLLGAFDSTAEVSRHLLSKAVRKFECNGEEYALPRFIWAGPPGGGDTFRLGLFATLNGDEPEGAFALTRILAALEKDPELARGYALFIYPLCNPTGFEDNTRLSRSGHALNRLFWTESDTPEVRFLESEIWMQSFHGIINLRSDADSAGVYGFASGAVLSQNLLEPALHAAETFLPRNRKRQIEGIPARRGMVYADIYNAREGALRAVPGLDHPPFEITLATPRAASVHLQVEALHAALTAILFAYNPVNGRVAADGAQWRLSPQLSYLYGPFGLLGEYAISHQSVVNSFNLREAGLEHTAWQLSAQWVLTGEAASFTGITPKRPFRPGSGGWGAWQLVGRFGQLDIDDETFPNFANEATSARRAASWGVGLNWWLNKNVRVMTSYSHTTFDGGGAFNPLDSSTLAAPATVTAQDESAFLTRLQLSF